MAFPQMLSMVVSVGAMYGYFVVTGYLSYAYYESVVPLYNTGAYWFFSLLSVPVLTVFLVDVTSYFFSLLFVPTGEMVMREIELNKVYSSVVGCNSFALVSSICRFGTFTGVAKAKAFVEDEEERLHEKTLRPALFRSHHC